MGSFELSQSHLVDKVIDHVGREVSASITARDTPAGKPLLHKDEYILEKNEYAITGHWWVC